MLQSQSVKGNDMSTLFEKNSFTVKSKMVDYSVSKSSIIFNREDSSMTLETNFHKYVFDIGDIVNHPDSIVADIRLSGSADYDCAIVFNAEGMVFTYYGEEFVMSDVKYSFDQDKSNKEPREKSGFVLNFLLKSTYNSYDKTYTNNSYNPCVTNDASPNGFIQRNHIRYF